MPVITEVSEALFAAIVRALILVARKIVPGLDEVWPAWPWKNLSTFGTCMIVAVLLWAIVCPLEWADIPHYEPRCTTEGFLLDALYPGFLAFLLNYTGEEGFRWLKRKSRLTANFVSWFGNPLLYIAAAAAVADILFLTSPSGALSAIASVTLTIGAGLVIASSAAAMSGVTSRMLRLDPETSVLIFVTAIALKVLLLFIPIDPLVKKAILAAINLLLLLYGNTMAAYD